jgi:hypothetical protein
MWGGMAWQTLLVVWRVGGVKALGNFLFNYSPIFSLLGPWRIRNANAILRS